MLEAQVSSGRPRAQCNLQTYGMGPSDVIVVHGLMGFPNQLSPAFMKLNNVVTTPLGLALGGSIFVLEPGPAVPL